MTASKTITNITHEFDERLTDNDFVHVHTHSKVYTDGGGYWYGTLLVADDPTSLVASSKSGMVSVETVYLTRAALTFDGYICFDCRKRLRQRLIGE